MFQSMNTRPLYLILASYESLKNNPFNITMKVLSCNSALCFSSRESTMVPVASVSEKGKKSGTSCRAG